MILVLRSMAMAAVFLFCSSCVDSTGIPYQQAARGTEAYLQGLPPKDLFGMKRSRSEEETSFQFNEGPPSKSNHIFPTRVRVKIRPLDGETDSVMKVTAHDRGLFLDSNNQAAALHWKSQILGSISQN